MIRSEGLSVWVRVGFTFGMFWGVVLWPLAMFWQNSVTYYACLVPVAAFLAGSVAWMMHAIWTEP